MPRTRIQERQMWEQLTAAVLEMGRNMKMLEARLEAVENPQWKASRLNVEDQPLVIVHE